MSVLSKEQSEAIQLVAKDFGWDTQPTETLRLILWALFHYYVTRL